MRKLGAKVACAAGALCVAILFFQLASGPVLAATFEQIQQACRDALRLAMLALIDGEGWKEGGQSLFSYAHPIFWAPYTIIGDGGQN